MRTLIVCIVCRENKRGGLVMCNFQLAKCDFTIFLITRFIIKRNHSSIHVIMTLLWTHTHTCTHFFECANTKYQREQPATMKKVPMFRQSMRKTTRKKKMRRSMKVYILMKLLRSGISKLFYIQVNSTSRLTFPPLKILVCSYNSMLFLACLLVREHSLYRLF